MKTALELESKNKREYLERVFKPQEKWPNYKAGEKKTMEADEGKPKK